MLTMCLSSSTTDEYSAKRPSHSLKTGHRYTLTTTGPVWSQVSGRPTSVFHATSYPERTPAWRRAHRLNSATVHEIVQWRMGMRPKSPLGCRLAENTRQTAWWMRWIRNIGTTAESVRLNQLNVYRGSANSCRRPG